MNMPMHHTKLETRLADLENSRDAEDIDAWVNACDQGTPFHLVKWMRAIESATGNKAYYFIAEDEKSKIVGLLPLHAISSPIFGKAMVSSGFAVGGGILADSNLIANQLATAAWDFAKNKNFPSLELRGGENPTVVNLPGGWELKDASHANFARKLAEDDDAELLAIPRKQRAEIRKGLKNNLRIEIGRSNKDIDWHYSVYSESIRNLGTPVFPKALMVETLEAFGDDADILTVLHDGKAIASVLSLYHNGVVMPFWGGGVWAARNLRANDVMYYSLMCHARAQGHHSFDFGRSKVESGAYFFKKNWGFEPQPLSYFVRCEDEEQHRDVNPNSPKYKAQIAIWKKLPLPVANFLGPFLSKGLG